MMIQNTNCGVSRIEKIVCQDMISALPEDLLVMILDLVPMKDAVATMFLSKRWLPVWTMKQRLEYVDSDAKSDGDSDSDDDEDSDSDNGEDSDDDEDSDSNDDDDDDDDEDNGHADSDDDEHGHVDSDEDDHVDSDDDDEHGLEEIAVDNANKKSVWCFLHKSLQLHRAPVICSLCIRLGPSCPTDADVGKLVADAVERWVFELEFKLLWSADPARLPKTFYSCKSLMTLHLSHKILVDVPSSASFPSLTTLYLKYVVYKDDDSLVNLLSSCPILRKLRVERNKNNDNVTNFTVKLPDLLYLSYVSSSRDNDGGDTGRCLVIDIPTPLPYFVLHDTSGDSCSIEISCLDDASIRLLNSYPDDKFLQTLSSVLSLALRLTDEMVVCCSTKFSRLLDCQIWPEASDWMEPTTLLLGNSPKLTSLTIDCENTYEADFPVSWKEPSSVPGCLSSHLEHFEWIVYGGREKSNS